MRICGLLHQIMGPTNVKVAKGGFLRKISSRDLLIWQIEEFLYPTSILSVIYHIRADAFRFFGP